MAMKHSKEMLEVRLKRLKENQKENQSICNKLTRQINKIEPKTQ